MKVPAPLLVFYDAEEGWFYRLGGHTQGPFRSHAEAMRDLNERWRLLKAGEKETAP